MTYKNILKQTDVNADRENLLDCTLILSNSLFSFLNMYIDKKNTGIVKRISSLK